MNECIFHIGMHKTGSSSIQKTLYHNLHDLNFHYADFGVVNPCSHLVSIFSENPLEHHYFKQLGWSINDIHKFKQKASYALGINIKKAIEQHKTLIISAEEGWNMSEIELHSFKQYMQSRNFSVKIVAYLRPWKSWLESYYQENVKLGSWKPFIQPEVPGLLNYQQRILNLYMVFGQENVFLYRYNPRQFINNCVVQDFCNRINLQIDVNKIHRSNDSLSLPAIKLLYTQRSLGSGYGIGLEAVIQNNLLKRRLSEIKGPVLRFHSKLLDSLTEEMKRQICWIKENIGIDLEEDIKKYDASDCISDEKDMFLYTNESVIWLAKATGGKPAENPSTIAKQMDKLIRNPSFESKMKRLFVLILNKINTFKRTI